MITSSLDTQCDLGLKVKLNSDGMRNSSKLLKSTLTQLTCDMDLNDVLFASTGVLATVIECFKPNEGII